MSSNTVSAEKAIFAAGCFWGVEYYFQKAAGVVTTAAGFIGGRTRNPAYADVCGGATGHAEAVEIVFDPAKTSYETLAKHFFEIHNPALTSKDITGRRSQYRSAVFYTGPEQKRTAEKLIQLLRDKNYVVGTEVAEAGTFFKAEEYHQSYYRKKGRDDYGYRYRQKF